MIEFEKKSRYTYDDFVEVVRLLRSPEGCPWDRVQTHDSIRRNFLEEVYECCEAIDTDDQALMQEELGDVMMQVIFHSQIEAERGRFCVDDVCDAACKKLIFRHPNIFGEKTDLAWEDIKAEEKGRKTQTETLDAVARSLPALWRADKLISKSARVGFVWPDTMAAIAKLEEEIKELKEAIRTGDGVEEELGDVLYAAVCVGAQTGHDPEQALHTTCEKFIKRFSAMEQSAATQGRSLDAYTPAQQLAMWQEAKSRTRWE